MEDVAGETLGVHADQRVLTVSHLAVHERDMLVLIDVIVIADDLPRTMLRRQSRFGDTMNQSLVLQTMRNELRDRDERELMLLGKALELLTARGAAILVEDLANHAGRVQASAARQVDRGLRVADALQHAALTRAQWEDVTAMTQIARRCGRIHRHANRRR